MKGETELLEEINATVKGIH